MDYIFIIFGIVGITTGVFGCIYIYNEVKYQLREADEIIDRFKREKKE